jgi:hypothetical protein
MVDERLLLLSPIILLSACSTIGQPSRSDFATASDSFGKTVDAANTYVSTKLSSYRRDNREAAVVTRSNQLRYVLVSGKIPATDSWKMPVDRNALLCSWQLNYFDAMASWAQVQGLRQPLSTLSQPSKETGFNLFFTSIRSTYTVPNGQKSQPNPGQKFVDQCNADVNAASASIGLPPAGVQEATGIPQLDAAVAAYQALDTFFGALGTLIDDQHRVDALKKWINDPSTQATFQSGVDKLRSLFESKAANNRALTSQTYVLAYIEYEIENAAVVSEKTWPTGQGQRAIKVSQTLDTVLKPTVAKMLDAADAYDAVVMVQENDQFQALEKQFKDLVALSNSEKVSGAALVAQAQQLQKVFEDGKDAYSKFQDAMKALNKTTATTTK